jgi:asparagine synthase (glutamine-hydrolysing)
MSFIAGIVSLTAEPLTATQIEGTAELVPADSGRISTYRDAFAALYQVDFGGFGEPAYWADEHGVTAIAGHPLLPGDRMEASGDGNRGARTIHESQDSSIPALLATTTGTWAALRYRSADRRLLLCSDRLGIRPLYWWTDGRTAVFASTLLYMERHPLVPLACDLQGVLEGATLSYILADRTPYLDVKRILGAEIIRLEPERVQRSHYFNWSELPERSPDDPSHEVETLEAFTSAVERRNGSRTEAVTLLSGGLDSRAVNAVLHELGVSINSFNFSIPNTQDAVFGREFARVINAHHYESVPVPGFGPGWVHASGRIWDHAVSRVGTPLRQLFPVWSGDFGSAFASFGGVSPAIAQGMRSGDVDAAIAAYLATHRSVAAADVVPEARAWFATAVPHAIAEQIALHRTADPARQFLLFYAAHSRRRNMDRFYEDILDHRTEFWTPFSDGAFMETALAVPIDLGVGHRFYMRWFNRLPPYVRQVPWQSYRGSVPCPLPIPEHVKSQWDPETRAARAAWNRQALPVRWHILLKQFPSELFRRHRFLARAVLHRAGLKNGRGPLQMLGYVTKFWNRSQDHPQPWSDMGRQ